MQREKPSFKVQSSIEGYSLFVIKGLIGIHGKSISDVVSFIITDWIDNRPEKLEKCELSVKKWKEEEQRHNRKP